MSIKFPKYCTLDILHPNKIEYVKRIITDNMSQVTDYLVGKYKFERTTLPTNPEAFWNHLYQLKLPIYKISGAFYTWQERNGDKYASGSSTKLNDQLDEYWINTLTDVCFRDNSVDYIAGEIIRTGILKKICKDFGESYASILSCLPANKTSEKDIAVYLISYKIRSNSPFVFYLSLARHNLELANEIFPTCEGKINLNLFMDTSAASSVSQSFLSPVIAPPAAPLYLDELAVVDCKMCKHNQINTILPCFHAVVCFSCASNHKYCPLCQSLFNPNKLRIIAIKNVD